MIIILLFGRTIRTAKYGKAEHVAGGRAGPLHSSRGVARPARAGAESEKGGADEPHGGRTVPESIVCLFVSLISCVLTGSIVVLLLFSFENM